MRRPLLLTCLATAAAVSTPAFSAELPREAIGVWTVASDSPNQCKKGDWENDRTDGMISVAAKSVDYWESSCKVASARKLDESTYELGLACGGEGQTWRSKEVWYVQKVDSREQLIAVSLDRSDEREAGKKLKNPAKHRIYVNVYLRCK